MWYFRIIEVPVFQLKLFIDQFSIFGTDAAAKRTYRKGFFQKIYIKQYSSDSTTYYY